MTETKEIWKDLNGYEGIYKISNKGRIKSLSRIRRFGKQKRFVEEKLLKPQDNTTGYLYITLSNCGKRKNEYLHRLVAKIFLENKHNKKEVNHKNGNKYDNRVENLEFATRTENIRHSITTGIRIYKGRKVKCVNTGKIYNKIVDAEKELQLSKGSVSKVCRGKLNAAKGYKFKYV